MEAAQNKKALPENQEGIENTHRKTINLKNKSWQLIDTLSYCKINCGMLKKL